MEKNQRVARKADGGRAGERYSNALQAASEGGYQEIIKLLLDGGADVNAQGGMYGNALQAASGKGHQEIVKLLLDNGADVKAQGGKYGNALQAASEGGHQGIVKLLLDKRAELRAAEAAEQAAELAPVPQCGPPSFRRLPLGELPSPPPRKRKREDPGGSPGGGGATSTAADGAEKQIRTEIGLPSGLLPNARRRDGRQ